jgi:probable rRNA maturation factor
MLSFCSMKFYLINNTTWPLSEAFLKWFFRSVCVDLKKIKKHQKDLQKMIGVVLVDSKEMRRLNRKYRKKNKITDVLSFSGSDNFLGDVVLCVSRVQKQARQHELADEEEFSYLLIHGLLHLLGYEHEFSSTQAKKMFKIQDKVFADLQDRDIVNSFKKTGRHGKKA